MQITPPQDMGKITQAQDVEVTQPQDMGKVTQDVGKVTQPQDMGKITQPQDVGKITQPQDMGITATRCGEDHSHKMRS